MCPLYALFYALNGLVWIIGVLAGRPTGGDFLHIVHHAVEEPLNSDLDLSSQGKTVQSLLGADVAKYRLDDGHALRIDPLASLGFNLLNHFLGKIGWLGSDRNR